MSVNWGLANNGYNALQTLQSFGAAQAQRMAEQQAQIKQQDLLRQQVIQDQVRQRTAAGDYSGAQQVAAQSGDFDLAKTIQGYSSSQREQLAKEGEAIGRLAYGLRQLPQQDRAAAFRASIPALRQQGFTDQEIQAASQDLSDGVLDGYVRLASDIQQQFTRSQPDYQVIPEGGTLVNTRDPNAIRQVAQPQQQDNSALEAQAQAAIAAGADPAQVRARLQQLQGGGGSQASSPFPIP